MVHPSIKEDGADYYLYVLLYVDDILGIMEKSEAFIQNELASRFVVKTDSISKPTQYLGNKVSQVTLENEQRA
jgi:hypothetical protein